ncbi:hypothetical protein T09_10489, partial [Trichinella sp. T9]
MLGRRVNWKPSSTSSQQEALFQYFHGVASSCYNSTLERSWCVCADQQPSGRLAQPHEQKSTKAPPG